jgi:hypothetical protein
MKNLIISLIVLFSFCAVSVAGNTANKLSTTVAAEKYGALLKNHTFLAFPELREAPLRWFDSIPEGKIEQALSGTNFEMEARPGEFFVFQIGLWAVGKEIKDVQIKWSDLKNGQGMSIPASRITCFNKGGTDFMGRPFSKEVNVKGQRVQALWLGVDLDKTAPGNYKGDVSLISGNEQFQVPFSLKISGEVIPNHGYNEGSRLSRLGWHNSTAGINEEVTKGFLPVQVEQNRISILGRSISIGENGLPASVISYFGSSNQLLVNKGAPIINHPFRFIVEKETGEVVRLKPGKLVFTEKTPSKAVWSVSSSSDELDLECTGQLEFDGFVDYKLKLIARKPLKVKDIRLEIPIVKEKGEYMMGLGHEGGYRTPDWKWRWDPAKNQDMLWVGAVNGGLRIKWKAGN